MKKLKISAKMLLIIFPLIFLNSCENNPEDNTFIKEQIKGYVQKGPYLIGTSISLSELKSDLSQTGKVFTTDIKNNQGAFEIRNIELSSGFVEITADGFYFNELIGENSSAQLTLSAVSDIRDKSTLNVNILAHLEKDRLLKLVSEGASFLDAKTQAQEEILKVFLIAKSDITESELLNISEDGDNNAILLAVSVILQGHLSVADMSELIGKLNSDLVEDGILDDPSIGTALINNARLADLQSVRTNLENRYKELDLDVSIPEFEKYIEYFIENSEYEFDHFPVYPETSDYGINILHLERDSFPMSNGLSLAAELPEGTSLRIVLKGGMWWYRFAPEGPKNWEISRYNESSRQQEFTASSPGGNSDVSLEFEVQTGIQKNYTIEYYENGAELPTRIREITIGTEGPQQGINDASYPKDGQFGPNILAMEYDTLSLQTGIKYSLAVDFPKYDEPRISYQFNFNEAGIYSVDPGDIILWDITQDSTNLKISGRNKDMKADMSILFTRPGIFDLEGEGISKIGRIY